MNAKTAKLLNRYAAVKGWPSRRVKRAYNMRPKRTHFSDKQEMRETIYDATGRTSPSDAKATLCDVFGRAST